MREIVHIWASLSRDDVLSVVTVCFCCWFAVMLFGWMFADEAEDSRRAKQVMALATLLLPFTFVLSPGIVTAVLLYSLGRGIAWLIGTAAGTPRGEA